jgi:uncharacterized protein YegL
MKNTLSKKKVTELIEDAKDDGNISQSSKDLIVGNLNDNIIDAADGLAAEDIPTSDVTLVTIAIDGSGSIDGRNLIQTMIDGQNEMIDALLGSKKHDSILMAQWVFNDKSMVLNSYIPLEKCEKLNQGNYCPNGMTDLYGVTFDAISANIAYAQQLIDEGTPVQSIVVVITDGEDTVNRIKTKDAKQLAKDVLKSERFVLAYIGAGDDLDHEEVSKEMGIPTFLKVGATQSEIRRLFKTVSKSIIRQSQQKIDNGSGNSFFDD